MPHMMGSTTLYIPSELGFSQITLHDGNDFISLGDVPPDGLVLKTGGGRDTIELLLSLSQENAGTVVIDIGEPDKSTLVIPCPTPLVLTEIGPTKLCSTSSSNTLLQCDDATAILCNMSPSQVEQHLQGLPLSYSQALYDKLLNINRQSTLLTSTSIGLGLLVLALSAGFFKSEIKAYVDKQLKKNLPNSRDWISSLEAQISSMVMHIAVLHQLPPNVAYAHTLGQVIRASVNISRSFSKTDYTVQLHLAHSATPQSIRQTDESEPARQRYRGQDVILLIILLHSMFLPFILFDSRSMILAKMAIEFMMSFLFSVVQSYNDYKPHNTVNTSRLSTSCIVAQGLWKGTQNGILGIVRNFPGGGIVLDALNLCEHNWDKIEQSRLQSSNPTSARSYKAR